MSKMLPINEVVESVSITHKFDKPVLKFLNTSDVENGKIININYLPIEDLKGQAKKTIKKHDILFSEIRPKNRRFAYVDIDDTYDFVVSTKLMVLRNINPSVDNKYFYYFLTNDHMLSILQDRAENRIGSFPQITFDLLSEYFIRVPKISDQQKIASVLFALDSKIELNNRINAELEDMAKTLYDYWFVQFDFPNAKGKPYKSSGGKMVWNEELKREVPSVWNIGTLEDLFSLEYGKPLKEEDRSGLGWPVLGSNGIVGYHSEYLVEGPGIVVGRKGTAGAVSWVDDNYFPIDTAFYVKDKLGIKNLYYHYLLLIRTSIKHVESSSAVPGLNRNVVYTFELPIPSIKIIEDFNKVVLPMFSKIKISKKENEKLTELRDWLLPMLMNGQVKVR